VQNTLNLFSHGLVVVPVVIALRQRGFFDLLRRHGPMSVEEICRATGGNVGYLRVCVPLLESLGWLSRDRSGRLVLEASDNCIRILPERIEDLLALPRNDSLSPSEWQVLAGWADLAAADWHTKDSLVRVLLDGVLVTPILLAFRHQGSPAPWDGALSGVDALTRDRIVKLLAKKGWMRVTDGSCVLTQAGASILERALDLTAVASYKRMLSCLPTLLFGKSPAVASATTSGRSEYAPSDRNRKGRARDLQIATYGVQIDRIILSVFDQFPLEEQPMYVAEMGCGDGALLHRIYKVVLEKTCRGKALDRYPLRLIGVDSDQEALRATACTLRDVPHLVVNGDIENPQQMLRDLALAGVDRFDKILHVRSFRDHERRLAPAADDTQAGTGEGWLYPGPYVAPNGEAVGAPTVIRDLTEHLRKWAAVVGAQGLVILESHSLDPAQVGRFLNESPSLGLDACHALSGQYLVEADAFLLCGAEVGLFPRTRFSRGFPARLPFTRVSMNWFEKKPYRIRHPRLQDLEDLLALESRCWPKSLRCEEAVLRERILRSPRSHCVLEVGNTVAGVVYSQRILTADLLAHSSFSQGSSLQDPQGRVVQLLGISVLPEPPYQGLGDELLNFMLLLCSMRCGVETVVAVTRCRDYPAHSDVPFAEYVRSCDEQGRLVDPILRFHEFHGAVVKGVLPGFRPEDTDNLGCGILVQYEIQEHCPPSSGFADQQPTQSISCWTRDLKDGSVAKMVEACVRGILGQRRAEAYAAEKPLRDMGLDSADLMELRVVLGKRFGLDMDATLLFRYSTVEALADYIRGRASARPEKAEGHDRNTLDAQPETHRKHPHPSPLDTSLPDHVDRGGAVAIIGATCRFPGDCTNAASYWNVLERSVDAVRRLPLSRERLIAPWERSAGEPTARSDHMGGYLEDIDRLDAGFFQISDREAVNMDPQHRLLLEVAWEALEQAGMAAEVSGSPRAGVFLGCSSHDYEVLQLTTGTERDNSYFATGTAPSVAAGRLAYFLNVRGATLCVDTACSSSLVAVHLACQSLRHGECDLALAGGVNIILSTEVSAAYAGMGITSPTGTCKTFDAAADGYVRGEGCGIVVLKRLSDALRDRDHVLAVIRGSAVNHDGRSNGLTAPNGLAQEEVIRQALHNGGVSAAEVSYLEAHGTGTALGDPIEMGALGQVFGPSHTKERPLYVGSVKTNIGHLEAAAGIAGLIKVVLSLQHGQIPAHLHFREPNPHIAWEKLPVRIPTTTQAWPAYGSRRVAGVSSFGMSGTNAHVVVEEAPAASVRSDGMDRPWHLLTVSARTSAALSALCRRYEERLSEASDEESLGDLCYTANTGRRHWEHRLCVLARDRSEAQAQLSAFGRGEATGRWWSGEVNSAAGAVGFAFGAGGRDGPYWRALYETQPTFRRAVDECLQGWGGAVSAAALAALSAEQALFCVQYGLSELWRSWGAEPAVVLGVGVGEYAAGVVSGVLEVSTALSWLGVEGVVGSGPYHATERGLVSGLYGRLVQEEAQSAAYWSEVRSGGGRVNEALETLVGTGCEAIVELGSDGTLAGHGRLLESGGSRVWVESAPTGGSVWESVLSALAALYVRGVGVDWRGFDRDYRRRKVVLPTYPWQRQRYWTPAAATARREPESARAPWLDQVTAGELPGVLRNHVRREMAATMGRSAEQAIALDRGVFEQGMDSLMAVDLRGRLKRGLGLDLSSTFVFDYPTINDMVGYLVSMIRPEDSESEEAGPTAGHAGREWKSGGASDLLRTVASLDESTVLEYLQQRG